MSREMAHKVILPPQKNYIKKFLKQRDINSYYCTSGRILQYHPVVLDHSKRQVLIFKTGKRQNGLAASQIK